MPSKSDKSKPRILIDLTDIEQWNGHHGGTQRVVYGIAKNFYLKGGDTNYDIRFISFLPESKEFKFSSFEPVYNRVEKIETEHESPSVKQDIAGIKKLNWFRRVRPADDYYKPSNDGLVSFKKSDKILILGKPWDNLDIQRTLSAEKQKTKFKLIQVVYDLVISLSPHLQNPVLYEPYNEHMTEAVKSSDLMLAISSSTANDLRKFCKLNKLKTPNIEVIRLGDDISGQQTVLLKPSAKIDKSFIACVGTVEIRKNHVLMYYAYKLAAGRGIELPQLVIVGGPGWLTGDIQYMLATDRSIKDKIIVLNDTSDGELAWIYKNCLFTIYPSMYEGWGLPIAESLAYGKLCLASNSSSMPEIAGNLIDYFSPYSTDECLNKIQQYSLEKNRIPKESEIKAKYITTSWDDTFRQVLSMIA